MQSYNFTLRGKPQLSRQFADEIAYIATNEHHSLHATSDRQPPFTLF